MSNSIKENKVDKINQSAVNCQSSPSISVIVPVYNAEKYLKRCIESILEQTFSKFECILVNDHSQDSSRIICDEYAKKDNRIKVIHKNKNRGTAQARKTGVFAALGQYIIFVDNDDWIEKDMLEKMFNHAVNGNYDIVCCDYYNELPDTRIYCEQKPPSEDKNELIKQIISWHDFLPVTWNKLIRQEIYQKVIFPETTYSEDRAIMVQVLYYTDKLGYINDALYHWCIIKKSASRNIKNTFKNMIEDYISYTSILFFIKDHFPGNKHEYWPEIHKHIDNMGFLCFQDQKTVSFYKKSIQNTIDNIKKDKCHTIKYSNYGINRFKSYFIIRVPVMIMNKLLKKIIKALKYIYKLFVPVKIRLYIKTVKGVIIKSI
jgi:glycosyltransferase involved in cell wall biosynthesis